MKKIFLVPIIVIIFLVGFLFINKNFNKEEKKSNNKTNEKKVVTTKFKEIIMDGITLNYHASIRMQKNGKVIYFDPFKINDQVNDADYIFITHSHYDHYSQNDIKKVMNDDTKFIITNDLENKVLSLGIKKDNITVVYPSKTYVIDDIKFDTIPSYNVDKSYHKKSYNWVGYNVLIDNVKYYVVGDSDLTDELKNVKCDVIFIPVGGTYTMSDKQASEAVNEIKPKYAVPIHYGETGSYINAENFVNALDSNIKINRGL